VSLRIPRLAQLALTVGLLAFLVHIVGWRALGEGLARTRWPVLAAMYGVVVINYVVMAACLRLLLAKVGADLSLRRVLLANAMSNLYTLVLPGDLMAGVAKWVMLSSATGRRAKVFSALVLNKIALALPPLLFGTLALALKSPFPRLPVAQTAIGVAVLVVAGLVLLLHPRASRPVDRWARAACRALPAKLRPKVESVFEAFSTIRAFGARDHIEVLSLSLLIFWLGILSFFCATRALGIEVPIATLVWISLALFVARLLPITFNNLGVREGLLILALGPNRVQPAQAVGLGLLMFSNTIWIGLIGAACHVALAFGWVSLDDGSRDVDNRC
jgi:uncharacterized membrane protein YbhN (UPF0104 family)